MESHTSMELWVGSVNDVPLVGTSRDMVDGFIALLLGDRITAEAKGYKGFLDLIGLQDLQPGSILQNLEGQTVLGCSAQVSEHIKDYIIEAVQQPDSGSDLGENSLHFMPRLRTALRLASHWEDRSYATGSLAPGSVDAGSIAAVCGAGIAAGSINAAVGLVGGAVGLLAGVWDCKQAITKPKPTPTTIAAKKATKMGAELRASINKSLEDLRVKLKERGVDLSIDKVQDPSNRGEHVFNNSLLKFYSRIIDEYLNTRFPVSDTLALVGRIPNSSASDAFQGNAPDGEHINMPAAQRRNISTWVAHIPEPYIATNNQLFAYMTKTIRRNAVDYMMSGDEDERNSLAGIISENIELMNTHRVYLDPQAAEKWRVKNPKRLEEFKATEKAVQGMLKELDPKRSSLLRDWVKELEKARDN
ncbi:hypothetical protein SKAU_G00396090 [Synaphobranchus kaupii]|uniref:Uncharacterized protein n=1 Tax=Synaphobranchus kaupii TaxID=118154 RepID=A0A9Q1ECH3_SYNKA|nr:hypothetical protein SKAU_G00396090 [Synaphobranchus kaupii]